MQPRETGYEKGYPLGQNAGASDAALGNPAATQARSADSYGLSPPAYIDAGSYQTDTYAQNDWRNGFKQGWMDGYVKGYANVNVGPGPQSQYFQPVPIAVIGDAARDEPPPLMQVPIQGWQEGGSLDTGGADTGAKDEAKKETSYGKYILGALGVAGVIGIGYVLASDKYSKNPVDGPLEMPETLNVLDQHGGFSAWITTKKSGDYTLWRPGQVLKSPVGTLIAGSVNPKSFYQLNNDVTKAMYKVRGYRYPVVVWFDNKTGKRIA